MSGKERWASRMGLVLAMAGNAVGLGNFLRFPAQAAKNGGGAFLIPYFVALVVLGLPLMWIEWTMGRYGGRFGHHSAPGVFDSMGKRWFWKYIGVFGLWCNLLIASYYLYIESWTMAYAGYSLWGGFAPAATDPKFVANFFSSMTGQVDNQLFAFSSWGMVLFAVCISFNVWILSKGLAKGIEIVSKIGMPLLIVFAMFLAIRGILLAPGVDPGVIEHPAVGLNFVWQPKYDSLWDPSVWLAAAGQIFFTLSIGMGSIHCYASYLREKDDITLTGAGAAWTNEFCEVILGGTILLPIAVAYLGLTAVTAMTAGGSGFGLGFMVFPQLFQHWGPGLANAAGFMWFGLLFFAAITSSLAMGQPIMAFLQTEFGFTRRGSAITFGAMLLPLSLPVALTHENAFFGDFDFWAGTFALVVFAFLETLCFGWVFGINNSWREMMTGAELKVPTIFRFVIKYVTPTLLFLILIGFIFKPKQEWGTVAKSLFTGQSIGTWEWAGDGMIGKLQHADLPDPATLGPIEAEFQKNLRTARTVDRLMMIGAFAGFSYLVHRSWKRRRAEGKVAS